MTARSIIVQDKELTMLKPEVMRQRLPKPVVQHLALAVTFGMAGLRRR